MADKEKLATNEHLKQRNATIGNPEVSQPSGYRLPFGYHNAIEWEQALLARIAAEVKAREAAEKETRKVRNGENNKLLNGMRKKDEHIAGLQSAADVADAEQEWSEQHKRADAALGSVREWDHNVLSIDPKLFDAWKAGL